jgi:hypothetical protein
MGKVIRGKAMVDIAKKAPCKRRVGNPIMKAMMTESHPTQIPSHGDTART